MNDERSNKRLTLADFLRPTTQQGPVPTTNTNADTTKSTRNNNYPRNSNAPELSQSSPPPSSHPPSPVSQLPYTIKATKKGGVPCIVESRKHHKVVVLSNIEGDGSALRSALQKSLGTGGVCRGNSTIEIQGEQHLEKVRMFCLNSGCVVGASKQNKSEAATAKAVGKKQTIQKGNETKQHTLSTKRTAVTVITVKEIKSMKPTLLKEHLAARQLSTQGNKKELLARLLSSVQDK